MCIVSLVNHQLLTTRSKNGLSPEATVCCPLVSLVVVWRFLVAQVLAVRLSCRDRA